MKRRTEGPVMELVGEATQATTLERVREQLPDDYDRLFESGSQGRMLS